MKIKRTSVYSLALLVVLSLFSCIDNAYDLSDIDSTFGVEVNNLSVPLQIDAITLQNILNLDDDSQIKEINGEYAFLEEGSFESTPIEVPSFTIPAPNIDPLNESLDLISYGFGNSEYAFSDQPSLFSIADDYLLFESKTNDTTEISTSFILESDNIDTSLVTIDEIGTNFIINLSFSFIGLDAFLNSIEIEDLAIQLPKGLEATVSDGGIYNPKTGLLTFSNTILANASKGKELTLSVSRIDTKKAGLKLADGKLSLKTNYFPSARFVIYGRNLKKNIDLDELLNLTELTYQLDITFPKGDIGITDFSGEVLYKLDGINVSPVTIDNIPDLLNQEGTDIRITNPQIYVSINNPLYTEYQLNAKAGIELTPMPKSDLPFEVKLTFDEKVNQFCLSPLQPDNMYVAGSTYIPFSNLGNILSGDKLPSKINIEISHPEVPQQTVNNFLLGQNLGAVKGSYVFYAPLALTDKAQIHYTDTLDGWSDEELDRLEVDYLDIEAKVQSNIPFGFKATAYPIDKNGDYLTKNGQPIEAVLQSVGTDGKTNDILPPLANTSVFIKMEGPLKGIDGIILKAILHGDEGNRPLMPNQNIQLTDIQLKVTGEYINEF